MGIIQHWSSKYIGLPYEECGRGPTGYDCWGLVQLVYARELELALPSYLGDYEDQGDTDAIVQLYHGGREDWVKVDEPRPLDVVMFNIAGRPSHVGVVVTPFEGAFLHAPENCSSRIENYNDRMWCRRIEGFYRHV
jgi:cell wall-associated NlpC family hydrolase